MNIIRKVVLFPIILLAQIFWLICSPVMILVALWGIPGIVGDGEPKPTNLKEWAILSFELVFSVSIYWWKYL